MTITVLHSNLDVSQNLTAIRELSVSVDQWSCSKYFAADW